MSDPAPSKSPGFTLLEFMIAMGIFLIICGAMFGLLQVSQQNYSRESQLSGSFQEARLAVDQIARDVDNAGYPSLAMFSAVPAATTYAYGPVAWSPNYANWTPASPGNTCLIGTAGGGTCSTPADFDLILETTLASGLNWIRYQLVGTTLYRTVVPKAAGTDPASATTGVGVAVPFLVNVMNNASGSQLAEITAAYPSMFPRGQPVPIFQYSCDTPTGPLPCPAAAASNSPRNVRDVDITLIVQSQLPDLQTHRVTLVELNGRGHRLNPSN